MAVGPGVGVGSGVDVGSGVRNKPPDDELGVEVARRLLSSSSLLSERLDARLEEDELRESESSSSELERRVGSSEPQAASTARAAIISARPQMFRRETKRIDRKLGSLFMVKRVPLCSSCPASGIIPAAFLIFYTTYCGLLMPDSSLFYNLYHTVGKMLILVRG